MNIIVIFGASGDLARKKIYPTLWTLFKNKKLPQDTIIIGFARSETSVEDIFRKFSPYITLKTSSENEDAGAKLLKEFASINRYVKGSSYTEEDGYKALLSELHAWQSRSLQVNHFFYLALPPTVFAFVSRYIDKFLRSETGSTRVIFEKPFGSDLKSYEQLSKDINACFKEEEIYRIDHYLGKELVQNILALRFSNQIFLSNWNKENIASVMINFKEDIGTMGRGGYFDQSGIIRDVMQNHLMQILSLVAMEKPDSSESKDIINAKVELLKCIAPGDIANCVLGQYIGNASASNKEHSFAYTDDPTVPSDSITPTFATLVLFINNERWRGVPFILKCGKALNEKRTYIRLQFKDVVNPFFAGSDLARNELVIKVQPGEAIYLKMMIKEPTLGNALTQAELDLTYKNRYADLELADAYARLICDWFDGNHVNFVSNDELIYAWKIFTPLLQQIDETKPNPIPYIFGSRGPKEADELCAKNNYVYSKGYTWKEKV